jgi:hypothetical protein
LKNPLDIGGIGTVYIEEDTQVAMDHVWLSVMVTKIATHDSKIINYELLYSA